MRDILVAARSGVVSFVYLVVRKKGPETARDGFESCLAHWIGRQHLCSSAAKCIKQTQGKALTHAFFMVFKSFMVSINPKSAEYAI